jgi:hypothetical protein
MDVLAFAESGRLWRLRKLTHPCFPEMTQSAGAPGSPWGGF